MGIKGRRKKLLRMQAKASEEMHATGKMSGISTSFHGGDLDSYDYNRDVCEEKGPSIGSDGSENDFPDNASAGSFDSQDDAYLPLKMKKSEFFRMQDEDYLEHIREEHERRRTSHLKPLTRKRQRGGSKPDGDSGDESDDARAVAITRRYLGHRFQSEKTLHPALPAERRGRRSQSDSSPAEQGGENPAADSPTRDDVDTREAHGVAKAVDEGAPFDHPLVALDPVIVAALQAEGFHRMRPIQQRTVPYVIEGYDLLGQARTGSGKTLAFCVPVLHLSKRLLTTHPRATAALILGPTKELCVQTYDVLKSVCQHIQEVTFSLQLITGGTKITEERKRLTAGACIVIGTPGRVHDHVRHCSGWDLSRLRFLVLDEADRMLADGFQRDLDATISRLPKSRQTLLFSATNSKSVRDLARLSLSRTPIFIDTAGAAPVSISLTGNGSTDLSLGAVALPPYRHFGEVSDPATAEPAIPDEGGALNSDYDGLSAEEEEPDATAEAIPSTLCQFCRIVRLEDRLRSLYVFVKRVARSSKAMVFCSSVASTTFHFQMMGSVGFHDDVMMLHGHMKHRQRLAVFQAFRSCEKGVLFCTDVAARGLDIPKVEWILQYDPPLDPTEYIHRIGRTARAGNVGNSLLFLAPEEANFIPYLSRFGIKLEEYPMPAKLPDIQEKLNHVLQLDEVVAKSAVSAFRAHVGAYQSHILKETFNVHQLNLDRLATSFALTTTPHITLPKNAADQKKQEYVKGKLKSLNRRKLNALRYYEAQKTKPQWENGVFVGIKKMT
ncbi:unnamed protein product [Phytomonas sp. EM1]|nr:unnamed protein product [Phytomonas sp. EM1]|eukprot:CCW60415.1 unnamed protein product [Phytomonas sp. isolate EM1]